MDQTKRPLRIPPEFSTYAEQHGIFDIYKKLLESILTNKPADPIQFMIDELKNDNSNVPQVILLGPPASGKRTISKILCNKFQCIHITEENLVIDSEPSLQDRAKVYTSKNKPIPANILIDMIKARTKLFDCIKKGYIIEGMPQTREQGVLFASMGIPVKHCIVLDAPDSVLIERISGKRIDPKNGEVYHMTFDMPNDDDIVKRLVKPKNYNEEDVLDRMVIYRRHIESVSSCFKSILKIINADQPKPDVSSQIISNLLRKPRTAAPHTPKIILLGPTGSGKSVQAGLLAKKYKIINVSCGNLIKQEVSQGSKTGNACKPYIEKGMLVPDAILLKILINRLTQIDCQSRGFVLHGYPRTSAQASQLDDAGLAPNRVFILDVAKDSVIERLTLRSMDPITGDRYHSLYNPPRTQEVKDRLQVHPSDYETNVNARLSQWKAYSSELHEYYEEIVQHINGDQDPQTVYECIESMSVKPLPIKLADDL